MNQVPLVLTSLGVHTYLAAHLGEYLARGPDMSPVHYVHPEGPPCSGSHSGELRPVGVRVYLIRCVVRTPQEETAAGGGGGLVVWSTQSDSQNVRGHLGLSHIQAHTVYTASGHVLNIENKTIAKKGPFAAIYNIFPR